MTRCGFVFRGGAVAILAAQGVGWACRTDPGGPVAEPARPVAATELRAVLAGPQTVELRWKDGAADEAGYFVEYTNDPEDPFVLLNAVPRHSRMAVHPDLAPDTRFIYRVVAFFGEASNVVSVTTGPAADASPTADPAAEPAPGPSGATSLRDRSAARKAAPAALTARLSAPTRVELAWKDRSRDEEGTLVEGTAGFDEFRVFAYVPPNVSTYTVDGLPPEKKCYFRVRAFYRGEPSAHAEVRTQR